MIDLKQAIMIAKERAIELMEKAPELEEIERGVFQGHDSWSITLSFPDSDPVTAVAALAGRRNRRYKRFIINIETGELIAMQIRQIAAA